MPRSLSVALCGRTLQLALAWPVEACELLFELRSHRNRPVKRFSDRSPRLTDGQFTSIRQDYPGEIYFPVVDVAITPQLSALARFAGEESLYALNGSLWPEYHPVEKEVELPASRLLEWENCLFVRQRQAKLVDFVLRLRVPIPLPLTRSTQLSIPLLSPHWEGEVTAYYRQGADYHPIGNATVAGGPSLLTCRNDASLRRPALLSALCGCLDYLLASRIRSQNSPFDGGFYLFYDADANTYRLPGWLWGWGPAIAALLACEGYPDLAGRYPDGALRDAAIRAGEVTLLGIVRQPGQEADGLTTTRWDPNPSMPYGSRIRVCAAADAGFLCGWAWEPLYAVTGDPRFREASELYLATTRRLLERYALPPQDYCPEEGAFTEHTLDESGFGVKAFDALYKRTGDPAVRELGEQYMQRHLQVFARPDGLWERAYHSATNTAEPCIYMTRGLGWAMEGLLSTYSLTQKPEYLQHAARMAQRVCQAQNPDGSFSYRLDSSPQTVGYDEKGTPLWSLLLYRLYRYTGDAAHLAAARRALGWCIARQTTTGPVEALGGLTGENPQSGVVYRPWFSLSCLYASGFFALALLEELGQVEREG